MIGIQRVPIAMRVPTDFELPWPRMSPPALSVTACDKLVARFSKARDRHGSSKHKLRVKKEWNCDFETNTSSKKL